MGRGTGLCTQEWDKEGQGSQYSRLSNAKLMETSLMIREELRLGK